MKKILLIAFIIICSASFADRWALPFYSVDKTKIACPVELEGLRGQAMADVIKDFTISEILPTDEFWYEQKPFPL